MKNFSPDAVLAPERFVEAFVAGLVDSNLHSMSPREPDTRRALSAVVDFLDRLIAEMESQNVKWEKLVPWIRTANSLRPSPLGGVENWEHQLRAAQGFLTRVPNPKYETVDFTISKGTARRELERLEPEQRKLVEQAVKEFSTARHNATA